MEANRKEITFDKVNITGGFWKEKQDLFREKTIGAVYDRFEETGRFEALKCSWKEGMPFKPHIFWESDVTKWIEGAAYFLQKERDSSLEEKIDELVERMANYQDENGYLNVYFTVVEPEARFTRRTDHELYCAGHLIEGAIAYANATGKTKLLDIAEKYVDLIDRVFREEHSAAFDTPGHEEIELALFKLYEYTGKEKYRKLAEYFIDKRGCSSRDATYDFADQEHMQSHQPVRMQKTAEGHSVRALYLYSAMAYQARITGEEQLKESCKTLFENITKKRMYITGGIGSTHRGESFTFDYDLPEYTAYSETCASIALALFCRRMWLLDVDGKYADCAERSIYNTALAGISLSGDKFFYENPLAADPERNAFNESRAEGLREHLPILQRVKVFDCSCCPPNILRLTGSIGDFMYSASEDTIYAHCYMEADAKIPLGEKEITLSQKTGYPYEGDIRLATDTEGDYTIAMRIPSWSGQADIAINGAPAEYELRKGYAYLKRHWKTGDEIRLSLSMQVKLWQANPKVITSCGKAAVTRGPLVYCVEGIDQQTDCICDIRISRRSAFEVQREKLDEENTLVTLKTKGFVREKSQELYVDEPLEQTEIQVKLIPYFAWANRGVSSMKVWLLEKES